MNPVNARLVSCPGHNVIGLIRLIIMRRNQAVLHYEEQRTELRSGRSRAPCRREMYFRAADLGVGRGRELSADQGIVQTTAPTISRWKQRFEQDGMDGLDPRHKAVDHASPMRRCRLASRARHNRNPPMAARIGRAVKWPRRSD